MSKPKDFTPEQEFLAQVAYKASQRSTVGLDAMHDSPSTWRAYLRIAEACRAAVYVDLVEEMAKDLRAAAAPPVTPWENWNVDRDYWRRIARHAIARGAK